jgi:proteasome lid subunit RPN8/RPN11
VRTAPILRFSPYAWAKLLYLRDYGDSEVGGFGIASANDVLLIEEVQLVKQMCTSVSVKFDDEAVADFFDEQVDQGRRPDEFARVWVHTHPGSSATPSGTDEDTFDRCFGNTDWAVMFILAKSGRTYARLRFNVGPGSELMIPVDVDFQHPFSAADQTDWENEFHGAVVEANDCFFTPVRDEVETWHLDEVNGTGADGSFDSWETYLGEDAVRAGLEVEP